MTIKRYGTPKAGGLPFAKAAGAEGWLYVSGQVPRGCDGQIVPGNMRTQAQLTLNNLKEVLESSGYSLKDVVRVGVWLEDPRDLNEFNLVYKNFFTADHAPARVAVQAMMMSDFRVEVDCIAYKTDEI